MAKYLIEGNYVGKGAQGLLQKGGSTRREVVERLIRSLGGTLEAFYFAFGETDVYVVADLPDNASMAAAALVVNATGTVAIKTTVLMTPEEIDVAAQKVPDYRPPGQ